MIDKAIEFIHIRIPGIFLGSFRLTRCLLLFTSNSSRSIIHGSLTDLFKGHAFTTNTHPCFILPRHLHGNGIKPGGTLFTTFLPQFNHPFRRLVIGTKWNGLLRKVFLYLSQQFTCLIFVCGIEGVHLFLASCCE